MSADHKSTDLVALLRADRAGFAHEVACDLDDLCIEAADEIERLRALVRELYAPACAELGPMCEDIGKDHPDVLRRALGDA